MANTAWGAQYPKWSIGPVSLWTAANTTTTANGTAATAGQGLYLIKIVASALEIASNDEIYGISVQANTVAASSTWYEIGRLTLGCLEKNGVGTDDIADTFWIGVYNPYDYQIRIRTVVAGTIDTTGINFTADMYPVATRNG